MSEIKTLHMTYDPMHLTRLLLQLYAEKHLEKRIEDRRTKFDEKNIIASYDYLRQVTDEELDEVVQTFGRKFNLKAITFDDFEGDCKKIWDCIFETEKYQNIDRKLRGYIFQDGIYKITFNPSLRVNLRVEMEEDDGKVVSISGVLGDSEKVNTLELLRKRNEEKGLSHYKREYNVEDMPRKRIKQFNEMKELLMQYDRLIKNGEIEIIDNK